MALLPSLKPTLRSGAGLGIVAIVVFQGQGAWIIWAGLLSALFGVVAWQLRWLRGDGAVAAALFGWTLLVLGDVAWIAPAAAFFVGSSVLSNVGKARKRQAQQLETKGHQRDAEQVLANGGIGWLLLLAFSFWDEPLLYTGFVGAFAAAAADTWATEIGTLSSRPPRSIVSGQPMPPGESGGVTLLGALGAVLGAAMVGGVAVLASGDAWGIAVLWTLVGTLASFFDSLLGATAQGKYQQVTTGRMVEKLPDETLGYQRIQGWAWVTNDMVNWGATLFGAGAAILLFVAFAFAS